MLVFNRFRLVPFAVPAFAIAALAGCNDEPTNVEEHEVAFVEVRLGTQAVRHDEGTTVTGGPLVIQRGANNITITFLDEDGEPITDIATEEDHTVVVQPGNALLTFAASSKLAGVLTGVNAGQSSLSIELKHGDHSDFGPKSIPVVVQ